MIRLLRASSIVLALAACSRPRAPEPVAPAHTAPAGSAQALLPGAQPADAPARWRGLIGEYGPDRGIRFVLEQGGRLWLLDSARVYTPLTELGPSDFSLDRPGNDRMGGPTGGRAHFTRDGNGRATTLAIGDLRLERRNVEPPEGSNQLRITPLRPVEELRREALAATPPHEPPAARAPDLVELTRLDSTVKLEIRYATTNNFLGTRFYEQARAFLQRPAAEALVRANRSLHPLGYGLLVHDAYRPWYVTKMFWDATPPEKRWLVANPAEGSKHNRGAAVDLTLYELATGQPVSMPSTYDESTDRAFADYPGGTSLQRWHRALLRRAMEAQGFTVNPQEWWHFDYSGWKEYPILNVAFERIGA